MALSSDQRQPGLFVWSKTGRRFVAYVGNLKVTIVARGRKGATRRWHVADVFGHQWLSHGDHAELDDAILEAEGLALREAKTLHARLLELTQGRR